jgi:arylsulfatase
MTPFLRTIALILAAACARHGAMAALAATTAAKPNIIVILADDMGFSDLGCYGGEIRTPNLDALAKGGLRFTQFYNTARCCPTRASLLTGLYPHQAGVGHMMADRGFDGYRGTLQRNCVTIAEALKPAGYRSYAVGKWHVTPAQTAQALAKTNNWPLQRGFDRYYGTIHGAGSYWDPSSLVRDNQLITVANDAQYRPKEFYYTDALGDHAVKFIREHARAHPGQPFFLYTAFTAAHWPMHAKESDIAKYRGRYHAGYEAVRAARWAKLKQLGLVDPKWELAPLVGDWSKAKDPPFEERCMEVYAAMVDCMDQAVGRLVAELQAQGQFENTLILYLQDNGGCAEQVGRGTNATARAEKPTLPPMSPDDPQFDSQPKQTRDGWPVREGYGVMPGGPDTYVAYGRAWANVSNTPFREYKHWTHEGGISTPLIAHWPAGIPASRRNKLEGQPAHLIDIMATCVDLAGAEYPRERDGHKIQPMEGVSLRPLFAEKLIHRAQPIFWEHEGNRAVRDGNWKLVSKENQPWELYDMERDRTELNDLASAEPATVKELAAQWDTYAQRANVLPLGAWRGRDTNAANLSKETRFELKAGAHLARTEAPAIAGRGFTITAKFDTQAARDGVIVAQGGSALGYALFLADGKLAFLVRSRAQVARADTPGAVSGAHIAVARLDPAGAMSLTLDGHPVALVKSNGPIPAMPVDGLDVGADLGGAVGPYRAPNKFTGAIESVTIQMEMETVPP